MTLEKSYYFKMTAEDLHGIHMEDPTAFIHFLIKLDAHLNLLENEEHLKKKLNFLVYELQALCEDLKDEDKIHVLNEYFFAKKGFFSLTQKSPKFGDLCLHQLLINKSANSLILVILYQYLANQINLPIYAIGLLPLHIVKWYHNDNSTYIDVHRQGKKFEHSEILQILNCNTSEQDCFEALNIKQIFTLYLNALIDSLKSEELYSKLIVCLDLAMSMDENNLNILQQRAILHYKLGDFEQAWSDFKRYFAFSELDCASEEVKLIYQKLVEMKRVENHFFPPSKILH
ncbi:MAG: hypothetical protein KDD40_06600 [Bdellovibrionales bacterium]|nr:hypothetical protein [Bdellovibrionales bacterium]